MPKNAVQQLLGSSEKMHRFINEFLDLDLSNCGSRYHAGHRGLESIGYYRNGILLLTSDREPYPNPSIAIATDKHASIIPSYDYDPKITSGELVRVWGRSEWIKRGPWEKYIEALLDELITTTDQLRIAKAIAEEEKARIEYEEEARKDELLRKEWK